MFTFTHEQLEQFLLSVVTSFAGEDGVYDFSRVEDNTRQMVVNRAIAALEASQPQRDTLLENSLSGYYYDEFPYFENCPNCYGNYSLEVGEDYSFCHNCKRRNGEGQIPFDGQPIPYESDSDSPAELGLLPAA